jgi:hypothetical protein
MELLAIKLLPEQNIVQVTCHSTKNVTAGIIVQNERGQPYFNSQYQLEEGEQTFTFPLTGFPPGRYHVWMSCEGEMKMSSFNLTSSPKKKPQSLSEKLAQFMVLPSFISPKNE